MKKPYKVHNNITTYIQDIISQQEVCCIQCFHMRYNKELTMRCTNPKGYLRLISTNKKGWKHEDFRNKKRANRRNWEIPLVLRTAAFHCKDPNWEDCKSIV